jgi:hypothetical protein
VALEEVITEYVADLTGTEPADDAGVLAKGGPAVLAV